MGVPGVVGTGNREHVQQQQQQLHLRSLQWTGILEDVVETLFLHRHGLFLFLRGIACGPDGGTGVPDSLGAGTGVVPCVDGACGAVAAGAAWAAICHGPLLGVLCPGGRWMRCWWHGDCVRSLDVEGLRP